MPVQIAIHLYSALLALGLGVVMLLMRKGTARHRGFGRVWVLVMAITATSSFWIREIGGLWGFSWIHLLSIYTLYGLASAVYFIRAGKIVEHRRAMIGVFVGVSVAGLLALHPERRLGAFIFGG
ncbi:MAG: DUF2306 domain-containing protein [Pseudomonadota bacterium]